jgi:hypothetical protein
VAARLGALCHDGVDAVVLQVRRLGDGRGRGEHPHAGLADGLDGFPGRQPEVKRGDGRPELEQRLQPCVVELDRRRARLRRVAQAELVVERGEVLAGARRHLAAHLGWLVAEEVELERPPGPLAHLGGLRAQPVHRQHRRAQGAEPARLAHGRGQRRRGGARHRRLEDRLLDAQ